MLLAGFCALSLAVALGAGLLSCRFWRAALPHGVSGLAGLLALGLAVRRGEMGGQFRWAVLGLAAAAALGGTVIFGLARRGMPRPGLLVMLHVTVGGLAYLLLAGFVFGR